MSTLLFEARFLCDLSACKGECCVEGESGAPLELEEVDILNQILPEVIDDLPEASRKVIESQGVAYSDLDGDMVTSIVNGRECVFAYFDEHGICKCAIEKAYREGRIDFYKPISCHLYPIRVAQYGDCTTLNYHRWSVCACAEKLGKKEQLPVYKFLKEPLIRRFGEAWYNELTLAGAAYEREFKGVK